jgi:ParB/RepB/Spo0J family partition protein
MKPRIEEIHIEEFDLSLMAMRIINMTRILQVERSMKTHGQLQPVVARVHEGGFQLIDGYKRVAAAENLMMDALQCRLLEIDEQQAKILMIGYNRMNQSMEVWEEALVLKDLLEWHDVDQRQLAKLVGHSPSWVSRRLSLISKIDEEVSSLIRMGVLTSRHARTLMRLPRGNQIDIARIIRDFHLTSRLSERLVDAYLEAEDEHEQRMLLAHPEYVLWHQFDLPEHPYDSKLSDFGNELMHSIMDLSRPLKVVLTTLGEDRINGLGNSEKEIIYPFLREMNDLTEKIMSATNQLQIHKTTNR